jgi:hypothetical protein
MLNLCITLMSFSSGGLPLRRLLGPLASRTAPSSLFFMHSLTLRVVAVDPTLSSAVQDGIHAGWHPYFCWPVLQMCLASSPIAPSALSASPPHPPHPPHPTPPHPPQNPGGQSSNCEAQPPPATNQGRQRSNTGAQHQVSQSSPKGSLGDWCWGARFLQAPAGKVIGLLRFSAETEVLGRRAGEGVQRRGVGGRKPRPIRGFSTLRPRVDGF